MNYTQILCSLILNLSLPLRLKLPYSDVIHLHGGLFTVVLVRVPRRIPLAFVVPEVASRELGFIVPGFGVGRVTELVGEESNATYSYVQNDEKLKVTNRSNISGMIQS